MAILLVDSASPSGVFNGDGSRPDRLEEMLPVSDRWVSGRACLPGVSEFFSDELAMILNSGRMYAGALAVDCVTVVDQLPQTHAAVADGLLDWPRARVLA